MDGPKDASSSEGDGCVLDVTGMNSVEEVVSLLFPGQRVMLAMGGALSNVCMLHVLDSFAPLHFFAFPSAFEVPYYPFCTQVHSQCVHAKSGL